MSASRPLTLTTPQAARTSTRDVGFLIRDMLADREFETFWRNEYRGRYESSGADCVTRVDSHDPNNLKIETANGQKFTVRIFAS